MDESVADKEIVYGERAARRLSARRESGETKEDRLEEVRKSFEEIKILSQRGCAIIAASHLDEQLGDLLRAFFVDDQRTADQVLEDTGAISAFGARIELASLGTYVCKRAQDAELD